jgi:hypothetical protein
MGPVRLIDLAGSVLPVQQVASKIAIVSLPLTQHNQSPVGWSAVNVGHPSNSPAMSGFSSQI